jgi:hypothetical protein
MRRPRTALFFAAALLAAGCASTPPPPPTVTSDLALLTLAAHHDALVDRDGETVAHPAWAQVPAAYARFLERGPGAIPELMEEAKEKVPFTWASLEMIAAIVRKAHPAPFKIPRRHPRNDYWVMTWEAGRGVSRISLQDVDAEREQALAAFEAWLIENGYLARAEARYYDIRGSSVFPVRTIALRAESADVARVLGRPGSVLTGPFREPSVVRLEDLPAFDEQWLYPGERSATWVFFLRKEVVAAFKEVTD